MKLTHAHAIGALALLAASSPSLAVTTFDPFAQFNVTPGGVQTAENFVFGIYNPATFTITPFAANSEFNPACSAGVSCGTPGTGLYVAKNLTGLAFVSGSALVPADRLFVHPTDNAFAGIGFVAPTTGTYSFAGQFSIQDVVNPTGVDTGARTVATDYVGSAVMSGLGGTRGFAFNAPLAAGETLAFYVGPSTTFAFDTSGLFLLVTGDDATPAVPEPATWALLIVGFGFIGAFMRRRRSRFTLRAA